MGNETDCGCSAKEKWIAKLAEQKKRDEHRLAIRRIKEKVQQQKEAERDLTGKVVGHWVVIRAAKKREANKVKTKGRKWVVRCTCGYPTEYVKATVSITVQSHHCRKCVIRKAPLPIKRTGVLS